MKGWYTPTFVKESTRNQAGVQGICCSCIRTMPILAQQQTTPEKHQVTRSSQSQANWYTCTENCACFSLRQVSVAVLEIVEIRSSSRHVGVPRTDLLSCDPRMELECRFFRYLHLISDLFVRRVVAARSERCK